MADHRGRGRLRWRHTVTIARAPRPPVTLASGDPGAGREEGPVEGRAPGPGCGELPGGGAAGVAELADAPGLGPGPFGDGGSNPLARTLSCRGTSWPAHTLGSSAEGGTSHRRDRSRTGDAVGGGVILVAVPLDGEYEPSPAEWVRSQVEAYEGPAGPREPPCEGCRW